MTTTVHLAQQNGVSRVTFQTESGLPLLSADVRGQLKRVLKEIESDAACRVVVFASKGKAFLAGADINELRSLTSRTAHKFAREGQRLCQRIANLPAVTMAVIHGACAGGGCELALACDLRIAASNARIGLPEVSLGILPGWGGTTRVTRMLGPAVAKRMILTGELFAAGEAVRIGLVNEVVADDQLAAAVETRISQIISRGPQAVQRSKVLIDAMSCRGIQKQLVREAAQFAACYKTTEPPEGLSAFLEKRSAVWTASQ